jgi:hypothetical protein
VVVITVDTEPVSRYDDFSGTDTLIAVGRANANMVLDFWESGGIGDTGGPEPTPAETAPVEPAATEMADLAGPRGEAV